MTLASFGTSANSNIYKWLQRSYRQSASVKVGCFVGEGNGRWQKIFIRSRDILDFPSNLPDFEF